MGYSKSINRTETGIKTFIEVVDGQKETECDSVDVRKYGITYTNNMLSMRLLVLCALVHLNIGQSPNGGSFRFNNGGMMRTDLSRGSRMPFPNRDPFSFNNRGMMRDNMSRGSRMTDNNYNNRDFYSNRRPFTNPRSNFNNLNYNNWGFTDRGFNNPRSNFNNRNQAFTNRNSRMGPGSPRPQPNYFSEPIVQRLLSFINKHRAEVDATNMYTMKWSERLASSASERSVTCRNQNLNNRIGESLINVPAEFTGPNMVDYIMKHWYGEKNTFRLEYDCRQTESCRYSQMIWSDSAQIGCASHWCNGEQFVVCLFHNKGNRLGQKPYIHGNHCEQCRGRCVNQLCAW